MNIIKNILLTLFFIGVIIGSFWISFNIGKVILIPVKKSASVEMITKEMPPMPLASNTIASHETVGKISFEVENIPVETSSITDEDYDIQTVKEEKSMPKTAPKASKLVTMPVIKPTAKPVATKAEHKITIVKKLPAVYRVQSGLFAITSNAQSFAKKIRNLGLNAQVEIAGKYRKVYVTASNLSEAKRTANKLRSAGFEAIIR